MQLNIEELIIRGAGPVDRRRLVQEVQAELSRLLAGQGLPPPTGSYPGPGETTSSSRKSGGDSVARQIARGIYQNLAGSQQGQTRVSARGGRGNIQSYSTKLDKG